MKKTLLSIATLSLFGSSLLAQNVNIPDANFKAYLVNNTAINTNSDAEIQVSEAEAITYLNLSNKNIADITGIEAFINLVTLIVNNNQLTSIDLSQNTLLGGLNVSNNLLTSIDISQNTLLNGLGCGGNNISTLDVSQNTNLASLYCENNNISILDLSQNSALISLVCYQNNISTLDLSNTSINQNTTLEIPYIDCKQNNLTVLKMNNISTTALEGQYFFATSNPNLTCIDVDDVAAANSAWTNIDPASGFSTNCSLMLGVDNQTTTADISIYPNPVISELTIATDEKMESIVISNVMGEIVKTIINPNKMIDISELPTGVYLLQIEANEDIVIKKIIKE